jgi:hypothetical protein
VGRESTAECGSGLHDKRPRQVIYHPLPDHSGTWKYRKLL